MHKIVVWHWLCPKKLYQCRPREEPGQAIEARVSQKRVQTQPCDPLALERGVRQLLADKVSGNLAGVRLSTKCCVPVAHFATCWHTPRARNNRNFPSSKNTRSFDRCLIIPSIPSTNSERNVIMNATLREQLKELRLSGLAQALEVRLQEAKSSKLDYAEFLEILLADELVVRRDRQIERRTKTAAFRDQKNLTDFDFDFNPTVKRKQIFDLASGDFVRKHRDAILVGPPGVGKSHIVQSVGRQLIREGYTVYYRSIFDCVRDFLHDEAFEGHDRILKRYLTPDLLILDDMGMKQLPKRSGEFLFEIIMRRHELRSTIMTSNRPLQDWGKLIGDVPAATAILDRFLQDAEIIQITGRSYRLRGRTADNTTTGTEASTTAEDLEKPDEIKTGQTRKPGPAEKRTSKTGQ
jgi:DNA replication protein DnaC